MARPKKKNIDWRGIEADFRANSTSIRELAQWYGVAEGTIRLRAKKEGWCRGSAGATRVSTQVDEVPVVAVPTALAGRRLDRISP